MKLNAVGLAAFLTLVCAPLTGFGQPILQDSFENGQGGWTADGQAVVSDFARRPGGRSLMIRQWDEGQSSSAWLSPVIRHVRTPITVSFWAAENYLTCPDPSYSACLDVVSCAPDGSLQSPGPLSVLITWDEGRRFDTMWGKLLPSGLVWKYNQRTCASPGKPFRLKFCWPKGIVRGECCLTDVVVTEAAPEEIASVSPTAASAEKSADSLALEISTPVLGNLFRAGDPLQFSALVYTLDKQPCAIEPGAKLAYTITDYQEFSIARGEESFDGAAPVADPEFYKSSLGAKRRGNLAKSLVVKDAAASAIGREFFIRVDLVSGGKVVASDTVTYGVVNPRPVAPQDYERCHFISHYFPINAAQTHDSIGEKTGCVWSEVYDYSWKDIQPHVPGPMIFGPAWPPFPRMYFCPNIEQMRGNDASVRRMAPPEALIPDPFHPGHVTFEIDPYVEYMVATIRHHRAAIAAVVPSGLERRIDGRTLELQRKAYAAIKKEFPDLPVGLMLYGIGGMDPDPDVDLFFKEKLYECCDFVDDDIYGPSVGWKEWERLKAGCRKLGRKPPALVSTEFSRVGGMDQVARSRDMILAHLDVFAHGMSRIYYYNCSNVGAAVFLPKPFLREPTDLGGDMTSGFMYMQRVDRPRISPDFVGCEKPRRWTMGAYGQEFGGDTLMPVLQAMTYYNLVQNFETSTWRETLYPDANSIAHVFDRDDATVAALWMTQPGARESLVVRTQAPFTVQDLFGRTERVAPLQGVALLTLDENPLTLVWDRKGTAVAFEPAAGGLSLAPIARGSSGVLTLRLPGIWEDAALRASCTVDGAWPDIKEQALHAAKGQETSLSVPVSIALEKPVGQYPLSARIFSGDALVGLLRTDLVVRELLTVDISGVPLTHTQAPAIKVTVSNLGETAAKGRVLFEDSCFAPGLRRCVHEQPFAAPARGSTEVLFPVERGMVNLTTAYEIPIVVEDTAGVRVRKTEEVSFRACEKAPGPITVDGDLTDWNLKDRTAIPFEREFTNFGKPRGTLDALLYTCWDADNLYFAALVHDESSVIRFNDVNIWQDDNIMLGIYPWGWKEGEALNSGYYREHIGLCKDGMSRAFRVGSVPGGPATSEGVKVAVKRTADGYVYEWAYPRRSLFPLALQAGARFRLSVLVLDRDWLPDGKLSPEGGIQFGGFSTNVDSRPVKWREFVLTE